MPSQSLSLQAFHCTAAHLAHSGVLLPDRHLNVDGAAAVLGQRAAATHADGDLWARASCTGETRKGISGHIKSNVDYIHPCGAANTTLNAFMFFEIACPSVCQLIWHSICLHYATQPRYKIDASR